MSIAEAALPIERPPDLLDEPMEKRAVGHGKLYK
jgi:hypothetical protein